MQPAEFHSFLKDPSGLKAQHLPQLKKLTEDFPYFQAAHMLLSIAARRFDASLYQQTLKRTAIIVPDRARLFTYIHEASQQAERPEVVKAEDAAVNVPALSADEKAEQDILILKASEIAVADHAEEQTSAEAEPEREKSPEEISHEKAPEEELEKEIGKQVVSSFVEKEILRTPELHKPATKAQEPGSFGDWLSFLKKNNGQPYKDIEKKVEEAKEKEAKKNEDPSPAKKPDNRKLKNLAIIDKIIEKNPGLIRNKEEQKFYAPDIKARESLLENEHLVTETLARIYALQGSVNKAVRAYEILSLKYPQKSAYFANLIQKLKNNS